MSKHKRDRGEVSTAVVVLLSLLLGTGAAAAAVVGVVNSAAPNDSRAVETGPAEVLPAESLLDYGG